MIKIEIDKGRMVTTASGEAKTVLEEIALCAHEVIEKIALQGGVSFEKVFQRFQVIMFAIILSNQEKGD